MLSHLSFHVFAEGIFSEATGTRYDFPAVGKLPKGWQQREAARNRWLTMRLEKSNVSEMSLQPCSE